MTPRGFTLVESILYVLFVAMILVVFATLVVDIVDDQTRGAAALEVQQNGRLATERLLLEIRGAKSIGTASSTFGQNLALPANAGKILSLQMASSTLNPTEFDVLNNVLRIRQGATTTFTPLTSNEARVSDLTFQNYSYGHGRNVGITLTVEYGGTGTRTPLAASTTVRTAAELRDR